MARFFQMPDASEKHIFQRLLGKLADKNNIHDVPTE